MCESHSVISDSLGPRGLYLAGLLCQWDFPGKNTGVGCQALLQGIFPTQGLKSGLHYRQILHHLSHELHNMYPSEASFLRSARFCEIPNVGVVHVVYVA